jgi:2-oxoglutarate/2-oxoacid ferredoxin oxidoreductase subunit alpha
VTEELTLSIVGSGGDGAVAAGDILSMACAREGLNVIKTEAYGPQIRGGESSCTVRISAAPIYAQADALDALVVFNWADFGRFRSEMQLGTTALILFEEKDPPPSDLGDARLVPVPFTKLAKDAGAPNGKNIVALGVLSALFDLASDAIRSAISVRFVKKGPQVVAGNLAAFESGRETATTLGIETDKLTYVPGAPKLLMSGNEASAVAAVDAGCRFFAGYPITPSSEILHFLGEWLPKVGGNCVQTEDELAAIGAVIGASFAGVKSMTSTSGPGLSLMSEMIGLSSMSEIPAVIVNVQRGGPSTGIPTKSEQSDLFHAAFGSHGDTPRVVIACSDAEDSYHATVEAFNIAEEFQLPVIVMSEQSIAQSRYTLAAETLTHPVRERTLATAEDLAEYRRYKVTDDGVSPMSIPGMIGGMYQTNGLEHDEQGRPSAMYTTHEIMNAKRYRKLDAIAKRYPLVKRFGPPRADLGILCWGSAAGPVREALEALKTSNGPTVAAFVPQLITPLPVKELEEFIASCSSILIIELSFAAQFYQYLRTQVDLPKGKTRVHARSGGMNLSVSEVMSQIQLALDASKIMEEVTA